MVIIFDRAQIKRQRDRSTSHIDHHFLFGWAIKQIEERLDVVRRQFPVCVQIGARGPSISAANFGIENQFILDTSSVLLKGKENTLLADEEFWPFAPKSLDLIVSALSLHTVNDLPGALLQINRSLKSDGLFVAAILGGETLLELRQCLQEAELELSGGVTPRVAPFADKPQMGALLQRAGFALPVVDSEIITVTYDSIYPLMQDLRLMGEGNAIAARSKKFATRALFHRAGELYAQKFSDPDGRIRASFEVIFLLGWAPHESQQKPLKPGSAKTRLADFLQTEEIGTGEKPN